MTLFLFKQLTRFAAPRCLVPMILLCLLPLIISAQPDAPQFPTRLADGPTGNHYVTDAFHDRLVILDASHNPISEITGLARPLGVAVSTDGRIFVGNDGRDNVEVYNTSGTLLLTIDNGNIPFPNDLALDSSGRLYVADSTMNRVRVYNASTGAWQRDIGTATLKFPSAVAINPMTGGASQPPLEIFVADQKNFKIRVFSETGTLLRSFGDKVPGFSQDWQGRFVKVQSLTFDTFGRLHALDSYMNKVQILNAASGAYMGAYGGFGQTTGYLNLPLDLIIQIEGEACLTSARNSAVEVLAYDPHTRIRDWALFE